VGAHAAAVELSGDAAGVGGVAVASWGEHAGQYVGAGGHHEGTGGGGGEHEASAMAGLGEGELLRESAAPGVAEDVNAVVAQRAQECGDEGGEPGVVVGQGRGG